MQTNFCHRRAGATNRFVFDELSGITCFLSFPLLPHALTLRSTGDREKENKESRYLIKSFVSF